MNRPTEDADPVAGRIWLSPPDVGPRERELLLDAFDSNWIAPLGPHVDALEEELAAATGRQHCSALASGTAALHLGLKAMGVGPADIVVTASQTFAATANAVVHCGATPVFVDSEADRWTMDPALLDIACKTALEQGQRIGAIVPVDLYGQCADHVAIAEVAARHKVPVLSDAAESLGASEQGSPAGSHGHAAVLSFNGNKIITGSAGGALVTDDEQLSERVTFLATQAREPARHYEHKVVGHNERMSNLIAAVIRGGLEQLEQKVQRRREIYARYREALADRSDVRFPSTPPGSDPNRWLTIIQVANEEVREHLLDALEAQDIEARPTWKPMHLQPVFAEHTMYEGEVAEAVFVSGICLPSGSSLSDADQDRVIAAVGDALG